MLSETTRVRLLALNKFLILLYYNLRAQGVKVHFLKQFCACQNVQLSFFHYDLFVSMNVFVLYANESHNMS